MATVDVGDDLITIMQLEDEPVDRLAREAIVLELYRRKSISSGRAAALLGMERFEFVRYASRLGIPYFEMTEEELLADLRTIDQLMSS
ncbi:MAG TPA: UPF0175 family protein [Thermomicrobiales bacterium]|nr:UPF0175 family protein [Thermomicrobiales bacterium]